MGLSGAFANGVPRTLVVTGGSIPATAIAVTGNVTVTGQTGAGYLAVTRRRPATPATSTLNFPLGDIRANGVFAPLDGAGALSIVYKSGTVGSHTHVVFDMTGYFEPGTAGLRFVPLNPARIMDTRSGRRRLAADRPVPRQRRTAPRRGRPLGRARTGRSRSAAT